MAFLPGLNKNGEVLILKGTTKAGTQAAAHFIFEPGRLSSIVEPRDGLMLRFEILLQTTSVGGSAQESRLLASRLYP